MNKRREAPIQGSARYGYFVIADITGYTSYLAKNELEHARGILSEITDLLISELSAPLRFIELEGAAVFSFAPEVAVEDPERLVDIMEACYAAFRLLQEQMITNTSCTCKACQAIKALDLKCVAHYGEYAPCEVPNGIKLIGSDVILTHRLLKNSVIKSTGIQAYAFLTSAFVNQSANANTGLGAPRHVEVYEELGEVEGRVIDLKAAVGRYNGAKRYFVDSGNADLEISVDVPAPPSVVWAYHIDASRRLKWQSDTTSVEAKPSSDGRTGIGAESYCDHGSYRLNHRVVDWRPFDYITMVTTPEGKSLAKPPAGMATFDFQELADSKCRIYLRMRATDRGMVTRMKLSLFRPLIKKIWHGHYATLDRLVREESARSIDAMAILPADEQQLATTQAGMA